MHIHKLLGIIILCMGVEGQTGGFNNDTMWSSRSLFNRFPLAPLMIVRIPNEKCDAGNNQFGTCMTKTECWKKRGTARGICGQGFGVCCIMTAVENGVAYGNNTLIYKDKFDGGVDMNYTILRMNEKICQIRMDVKRLYMYEVAPNGGCPNDYLTVNQDIKFKKVCGLTENIHYYLDVASQNITFTFHTDGSKSYTRDWEIYVSQYTCDMAAPPGCGQWYWGITGMIDIWANIDPKTNHWYYIDDQIYTICVRWEAGYCSITYNEKIRFQPRCNDLMERPGRSGLQGACITSPPTTSITYTLYDGLQYFYIQFTDNTNIHIGTATNPYKNPRIAYTQNLC